MLVNCSVILNDIFPTALSIFTVYSTRNTDATESHVELVLIPTEATNSLSVSTAHSTVTVKPRLVIGTTTSDSDPSQSSTYACFDSFYRYTSNYYAVFLLTAEYCVPLLVSSVQQIVQLNLCCKSWHLHFHSERYSPVVPRTQRLQMEMAMATMEMEMEILEIAATVAMEMEMDPMSSPPVFTPHFLGRCHPVLHSA